MDCNNASQAILSCADLIRRGDPTRPVTPLTIDSSDSQLVVSATDGRAGLVFRLEPDVENFGRGTRTGRCDLWPKWGNNPWAITAPQLTARCEPRTPSGGKSKRKTRVVQLRESTGNPLMDILDDSRANHGSVRWEDGLRDLAGALEHLHSDAGITLFTDTDGHLALVCGPLVARFDQTVEIPAMMHFRAGLLEDALSALDQWGSPVITFPLDPLGPLIIDAGRATALVMPMRKPRRKQFGDFSI